MDASAHWPLPPAELERRLTDEPLTILSARGDVGGVMGVKKLGIAFQPSGQEIFVKWKRSPRGDADGWNNAPRKEIAAYQIQKWFLDAPDYVVPTVVMRCLTAREHAPLGAMVPTLPGGQCVLGALTVWLEEVTVPEVLFDRDRFTEEPLYARHLANFNLLTYLIDHRDGRTGNFLTSEIESERRVFSIDNGVAFGARVRNFFVRNWHTLRVPKLPRTAAERLRQVTPEQVESLGVVAELRADELGVLRTVAPGANRGPRRGARTGDGFVQLGLTESEITAVRKRLEKLRANLEAERYELF